MITRLLAFVPIWGWLIAAGVAITGVTGWHLYGVHTARVEGRAEVQTKWDADKLARAELARQAADEYRAKERALNDKLQEAQRVAQLDNARNSRIAAGLRADADRMRNDIAAFASGGGGADQDTLAAARERAASLGQVLDDVLRDYRSSTEQAEADAARARAVFGGWPVGTP